MTVKIVIGKRELEASLSDRRIREKSPLLQLHPKVAQEDYGATRKRNGRGWRPSLEGIPELN